MTIFNDTRTEAYVFDRVENIVEKEKMLIASIFSIMTLRKNKY